MKNKKSIGIISLDSYEDPLEQLREGVLNGFSELSPIYLLQDPEDEMVVHYCNEPFTVDDIREEDDHGSEGESP